MNTLNIKCFSWSFRIFYLKGNIFNRFWKIFQTVYDGSRNFLLILIVSQDIYAYTSILLSRTFFAILEGLSSWIYSPTKPFFVAVKTKLTLNLESIFVIAIKRELYCFTYFTKLFEYRLESAISALKTWPHNFDLALINVHSFRLINEDIYQ